MTIDSTASLKRIAWAYGCAKKGSAQERILRDKLVAKIIEERLSGKETRDGRV